MKTKSNLLFKILVIYNIIATIIISFISISIKFIFNLYKIINYENLSFIENLLKKIKYLNFKVLYSITAYLVFSMIVIIPILYFMYKYMEKIDKIERSINNLEIINKKFSLKNLCIINIIHNSIFIFNLGLSISLIILEIIAIFIYLNINKITTSKIYVNFISKIINKIVYIIFILIFLFTMLYMLKIYNLYVLDKTYNGSLNILGLFIYPREICSMLISVPYLYLIYLYFNKKINNCNNVKINFIFKLICGITIIHNLVFPFNRFYSIPLFILEMLLIVIYLLYIFSKINLRFKPLVNTIIWIIFIVIYFKTSYLLALISIFRFFK